MDVLTPEQRRKAMQHNKSKDTKPEILLRKRLWSEGIRYRKNYRKLPGSPDVAITHYKVAVFVDGEFWHGKDFDQTDGKHHKSLRQKLETGSNSEYWVAKIERNIQRDREADAKLTEMGWTVIHFWSMDVTKHLDDCASKVCDAVSMRKRALNDSRIS